MSTLSPDHRITVDNEDPVVNDVTAYAWNPDEAAWQAGSGSTVEDVPHHGTWLVRLDWTSLSTQEIRFRLVTSGTADQQAQDQDFVEYSFVVETDGRPGVDAGDGPALLSESQEKVHLANDQVPVVDSGGSTVDVPTNGCASSSEPALLWGSNRDCYFLIETASSPSASNDLDALQDASDYVLHPIVENFGGGASEEDTDADAATTQEVSTADPNVDLQDTPTLDPSPPELRVKSTMDLELSGNEEDVQDSAVWACHVFPDSSDTPNPDVDDPFAGYMTASPDAPNCQAIDHPVPDGDRASGRAFDVLLSDGTDEGDRELSFNMPSSLRSTDDGRTVDQIYMRTILRDQFGNLFVENWHDDGQDQGLGVLEIAEYEVQQRGVSIGSPPDPSATLAQDYDDCFNPATEAGTACSTVIQAFQDTPGCFQAGESGGAVRPIPKSADRGDSLEGDNQFNTDFELPCFRARDLLPDENGEYGSIDVPIIIENWGNSEDTIVVRWGHRDGAQSWDVDLVDTKGTPNDPSDDSAVERRLEVTVPERTSTLNPSDHRVLARFTPDSEAEGLERRTVNVTVWSGESEQPLVRTQDLFVEAGIVPVTRASLTVGGAETTNFTVEPDSQETASATLTNTGNLQKTFRIQLDGDDSVGPCGEVNAAEDDTLINLESTTTAGTRVEEVTLDPGESRDLNFEVDVGRQVETSDDTTYRCQFQVMDTVGTPDDPTNDVVVPIEPSEPALRFDVEGTPELRILQQRGVRQQSHDVTGEEIVQVVPPTVDRHEVVLYLENNGTVALQPDLDVTEVANPINLAWELKGRDTTGSDDTIIDRTTVEQAFELPLSDADDPTELEDLYTSDHEVREGEEGVGTDNAEHWECATRDDQTTETDDSDPRVLCKLPLLLDVSAASPISKDEVVLDLAWADSSQGSPASTVRVRFLFGHVGEVTTDSVSRYAIGTDQSSTVEFLSELSPGSRFDPDQQHVPSEVQFSFSPDDAAPGDDPVPCVNPEATQTSDGPVSVSENASSARHRLSVSFQKDDSQGCAVSKDGDAGSWTAVVPGPGDLSIDLTTRGENGTALRQVTPAHVRVVDTTSTTQPNPASQLALTPANGTLQANGTQSIRFKYDDRGQAQDGVVLSRRSTQGLTSYVDCSLDGEAARLSGEGPGGGLAWTRLENATEPADASAGLDSYLVEPVDDEESEDVQLSDDDGPRTNVRGQILERVQIGSEERAVHRGNVEVLGWGSGTALQLREGWNPLVFYIEDADGDAALPRDHQGGVRASLEIGFLVNRTGADDDRYLLTGENDQVQLRSLGGGFYTYDLYLPDGLADLPQDATVRDQPTDEGQGSRIVNDWSVRLEVDGRSRGGDDLNGEAFWTASEFGLASVEDNDRAAFSTDVVDDGSSDDVRTLHTALRFLGGPFPADPSGNEPFETGPGVHQVSAFFQEEEVEDARELRRGGVTIENVRDHVFESPSASELRVSMLAQPEGRFGDAIETTRLTPVEGVEDLYRGALFLEDTGKDRQTWFSQFKVQDTSGDATSTLLSRTADVEVDARRDAAAAGIPLPLCIDDSGDDASAVASPLFQSEELGDRTILDTRAVPGLLPDRGSFSLTPVLTAGGGVVHDVGADVFVQGEGLVDISSTELPGEAEVDVPIPLSVKVTGPVADVTAKLTRGGNVTDQITLAEDDTETGLLMGDVTPTETGTHQLAIVAEDVAGGVDTAGRTVEVLENTPPAIAFTRPVPVDGVRAMRSDGTFEARVTDSTIAAEHVTLLENVGASAGDGSGTGDGGSGGDGSGGVSGQPLAPSGGIEVVGVEDTVEPGSFDVEVNATGALDSGGHAYEDVHAWLNVTNASDGSDVDAFDGDLDADGNLSGSVSLPDAGTYTLTVQALNTTTGGAGADVADETFTVEAVAPDDGSGGDGSGDGSGGDGSGSGDFTEVPASDYDISCETASCTVTYQPGGLSDGQAVAFRVEAAVTPEDTNANETTVLVDDQAPTPDISIGSPSAGSSPARVSSDTAIDVSADDNTAVSDLVVTGLRDGTVLGSQAISGSSEEVDLSAFGVSGDGPATLELSATDVAGNTANTTTSVVVDATGPTLEGVETTRGDDGSLNVRVTATDEAGVQGLTLRYELPDGDGFTSQAMQAAGGEEGNRYAASVEDVPDAGTLRYYIEATDRVDNQATLGSQGNPRTVNLGDVPEEQNEAPEVSIVGLADGDNVSGTIEIQWSLTDPDGDTVTVERVRVAPAAGDARTLTVAGGSATLDTTELAEGAATITVTASDGIDTGTASVDVVVDNAPSLPTCPDQDNHTAGEDRPICFELETEGNVTDVTFQLLREGEVVVERTLEPNPDGQYQTSVDVPEEGVYTPKVTKTYEDGSTQEVRFASQTFGALDAIDRPTGAFVAVLVLGAAVVSAASYAAFGRWN